MRNVALAVLALAGLVALTLGLRSDDPPSPLDAPRPHVHTVDPRNTLASEEKVALAVDRSHPGYAVYQKRGCTVCHGADLEGSNMGPSLATAGNHWTPETFALYLANPDSVVRVDERLQELDARYRMFVMPGFDLDAEELEPLTRLVLHLD